MYPDTELLEPEVKLANDIMAFKKSFKSAMLKSVSQNKDIIFLYDSNHVHDQLYVDFLANFINMFDRDSIEVFDKEFCHDLVAAQKESMENQLKNFPKTKSIKKISGPIIGSSGITTLPKDTFAIENGSKMKELSNSEYYALGVARIM